MLVSGALQLTLLALVMLARRFRCFVAAERAMAPFARVRRPPMRRMSIALVLTVGVGVGLLTGIVGIGGGFSLFRRWSCSQTAHDGGNRTSLVVIAMNSASGFLGHSGHVTVPWAFVATFSAVAIGGILIGTRLVRYVSQAALKQGFAAFLVAMGILMLFKP